MGQSPYLYGFGEHEVFGEASGETVDVLAFPTGPSLTVLASSVPSAFFQYGASGFFVFHNVFHARSVRTTAKIQIAKKSDQNARHFRLDCWSLGLLDLGKPPPAVASSRIYEDPSLVYAKSSPITFAHRNRRRVRFRRRGNDLFSGGMRGSSAGPCGQCAPGYERLYM